MLGKTLSHYTITAMLGQGGMGSVYLARDDRLGRSVALKALSQAMANDTGRKERFLREARAAAALKHPNVAQIYDVGEVDGISFLVMEHVEGETLAARLGRSRITVPEAVAIMKQACDAIAEAHGRDIVHRDLKPANVMLTRQGQVKILDFGLARQLDAGADPATVSMANTIASTMFEAGTDLTVDGQILGTVPYMSPEQAQGGAAGPPSDVFSLGIVFYEMLTGRRPFQGDSPRAIVESILEGSYPPVAGFISIPEPLVRVLDRCLFKNPQDRYPNALAIRDALRGLEPTLETATSLPARAAAAVAAADAGAGASQDIESLAVLPFLSREGSDDTTYLGEGIAEGIIRALSRLPGIRVLSRHASFALQSVTSDIAELGSRLGVDALVLGHLSSPGDRIVLNVELVATSDHRCIWGDRLECAVDESVDLEHTVVEQLTPRLQRALSSDDVTNLIGPKAHPQAYLLFLKGRPLLVGSAAQMEKGAEYLQEAIRLDPSFAIAHAVLAESYYVRAYHGLVSVHEASRAARKAARAAVRLGPALGESHTAAALIAHGFDWTGKGPRSRSNAPLPPALD